MTLVTDGAQAPLRTYAAVRGYVERVCFKTGPPGLVGTELEWLVVARDRPDAPVPIPLLQDLLTAAGPLPERSAVTFEPGGQLELSSQAFRGSTACWRALSRDTAHVRAALDHAGLQLLGTALDPYRSPRRQLRLPRYDAMDSYFTRAGHGACGETMMNSTAALQVNLDVGPDRAEAYRRWRLLHQVGPTLVAAFANSPVHAGAPTGWRSGRQQIWQDLDPMRTAAPAGTDPVTAFTDFLLDAPVMLQRREGGDWSLEDDRTFRQWVEGETGVGGTVPRAEDLELHLTTLFPPVRPRGWFEIRYLDAQPEHWWPVPMAVLAALVEDPCAGAAAAEACAGVRDWRAAARDGYALPGVQQAATACFEAALRAMRRAQEAPELVQRVSDFDAHYVSLGRSPADEPIPEVL